MQTAFRTYLRELRTLRATGEATEHSYRSALEALIKALGGSGIEVINEPAQGEYGAPDFIVLRDGAPVGHIECKTIGANLDHAEASDQLRRYRDALPNLLLTDYVEFRWYVNGERRDTAIVAHSSDERLRPLGNIELTARPLWENFFNADAVSISSAAELAQRMAGKTRLLREHIRTLLDDDEVTALRELLDSYREVLISKLDAAEFADLQAQTVAYGLFAARWLHQGAPQTFTRETAAFAQTTPFLREVFGRVAGTSADSRITWIVNDLALLLARADMSAILEDFGKRTKQEDPVIHFYEDFLAAYDKQMKAQRGVFYTPEPVVSYIVRSVDKLLRDKFDLADGLADTSMIKLEDHDGAPHMSPRVLVLDPAAGTGSFLREVVSVIRTDLEQRGMGGAWSDYVRQHLLPRLFGFELLMAPYAIAHFNLAIAIGADPRQFMMPQGDRLNVFLTNSLEEAHETVGGPSFAAEIARERREADAVKRDHPVMVVIGNPPYSGHSANKGAWIRDLLRGQIDGSPASYFLVDGQPLDKGTTKWLNDDYVKFIRFAQWRIEQTGEGALAFITNHSYLDNPTFRGMRQSLLETFDDVYVLDLHGNSNKKERSPDGGVDQNVFDIQQGVAIGFFLKHNAGKGRARVYHADLWGERDTGTEGGKYGWLAANDVKTTDWSELAPRSPDYWFVPRDDTLADEYRLSTSLTDIFPLNSVGVVTARDKIAICWTREEMGRVALDFAARSEDDARMHYGLGKDAQDWKVASAQADIREHPDASHHVVPILHRPFDTRFTYYTGVSRGFICRPRAETMRHMLAGPNLGLISSRAQATGGGWDYCGVTRDVLRVRAVANGASGVSSLFPLYIYPQEEQNGEGRNGELGLAVPSRSPNLAPEFAAEVAAAFDLELTPDGRGDLEATFGPEDVFHYVYAILHSPEYRSRYADFLKSDFPRIPLPDRRTGRYIHRLRRELFAQLVELGGQLSALHLMESDGDDQPTFDRSGANIVEKVRYNAPGAGDPGRVYINATQYFTGVSPETWSFTIGGYQPAQKWLSDRKGRELSFDDIAHYRRICAALAETPRLMARIDDAIGAHGGWPLSAAQ